MLKNRGAKILELLKKQEQEEIEKICGSHNDAVSKSTVDVSEVPKSAFASSCNEATEIVNSVIIFKEVEQGNVGATVNSKDECGLKKKTFATLEVLKSDSITKNESSEINMISCCDEIDQGHDEQGTIELYSVESNGELQQIVSDVLSPDDNTIEGKSTDIINPCTSYNDIFNISGRDSERKETNSDKKFKNKSKIQEINPESWSDDSVADPLYELPIRHHVVADAEEDESMTTTDNGRPQKGRKRRFKDQSRAEGTKRRNSNITYLDYKGRKKESRNFIEFDCQCKLNCAIFLSLELRKREFDQFWSLESYNCQNNYIAAAVHEVPKKRNYGRNTERRNYSRCYKIADKVVCREMFVKTFGISPCRVNTALKKFHGRAPLLDQRGVNQGGRNRTPDNKVEEVINKINKIPKYISHYSRKKTDAKFLPPDVTLNKMYEVYSTEYANPVSITKYKKIFYSSFNLRTKTLKKDTCNICDSLKMQVDNETNNEKKQELTEKHRKHLEDAEHAQALRREDFGKAREQKKYECLTFDLEKTLPLPRIPTNIVFYKRQLWVYNADVHSGSDNRGYCYVWAEGTAGRGAQEIGSCLLKHIQSMSSEVRHLLLWSDSCGGQNRNIKLTLMLKHILHSSEHLIDITLKFLCSGHSFLPNDTDFSDIESALKHQQRMYLPSDYINVMKNCRKKNPLVVTEMSSKDFFGITNIEKNITNRKTSVDGEKINWLTIRSIKMTKDEPFLLYIQQNTFDDPYKEVNIKKITRGRPTQNSSDDIFLNLVELWPKGKAIAEPKLVNLREMYHLLPSDCLSFYQKLKGNANIEEDVEGFNTENVDFCIEEN